MSASTSYMERAGAEFTRRLRELGIEEAEESAEDLGRRAAIAVAAEAAWEGLLGTLLTSAEARGLLGGISREALRKQVKAGRVLALRDERGLIRYPAWQFDALSGRTYPAVADLISLFRKADVDMWMLASFCATGQPELDGRTPAMVLVEEADGLLEVADRAIAALIE